MVGILCILRHFTFFSKLISYASVSGETVPYFKCSVYSRAALIWRQGLFKNWMQKRNLFFKSIVYSICTKEASFDCHHTSLQGTFQLLYQWCRYSTSISLVNPYNTVSELLCIVFLVIQSSLNKRRMGNCGAFSGVALINFFLSKCDAYLRAALIRGGTYSIKYHNGSFKIIL